MTANYFRTACHSLGASQTAMLLLLIVHDNCRAMLCISAAYAVMRSLCVCLSEGVCVCVSVTFVDHVHTNKDIFEFFSPSDSHIILVFPYQTGWRYSDGNPRNGGRRMQVG